MGRDDAELARRAARTGYELAELREFSFAGTPDEVVERVKSYEAAGLSRCYLQVFDLADLAQLELVASAVAPHL